MLSDEELEKWEAGRDLLKEIEDGIDEMIRTKTMADDKYEKVNDLLTDISEKVDDETEKYEKLGIDKTRLDKLKKIVVDKKKTFDDLK
jgi:ATP phosphoribosyltransferase